MRQLSVSLGILSEGVFFVHERVYELLLQLGFDSFNKQLLHLDVFCVESVNVAFQSHSFFTWNHGAARCAWGKCHRLLLGASYGCGCVALCIYCFVIFSCGWL